MPGQQRSYSDEERANAVAAVAANNGNVKKTARDLGIPRNTIDNWLKGTRHPESALNGERKKLELAERLKEIAHDLLDAAPKKIAKANLQQTMTSLGIAIDKARLLLGLPTAITETKGRLNLSRLTNEELDAAERIADKAAGEPGGDPGGKSLPGSGGIRPPDVAPD